MSNTIINSIKTTIVYILTILGIFSVFLLLQNQNTMVLSMQNETSKHINPEIFFTTDEEGFNGTDSRQAFKIQDDKYYFDLPDIHKIKALRLDPSTSEGNISITSIDFTNYHLFTKSTLKLSLSTLKPSHHIENYTLEKEKIVFSTIGEDPQLIINLLLHDIDIQSNIHFDLFLISILIFIVCLFVYHIYKTNELNESLTIKLIVYALFLGFALFKVTYYADNIKKFYPPDELAHLAYIDYVNTHNELIPKFENMRMLNNKEAGNYLSHPPLYYKFISIALNENISIYDNVQNLRKINMLIFIASFLLLLYIGFSSKISLLGHLTYLSFITSIPMFAYSGGSISNDNLAILGSITFIIGLKKILEGNFTNSTFFIVGIGVFLAYFSKLTAAMLIFFALLLLLIYTIKSKNKFPINKLHIAILTLFLVPILYYQVHILINYHSLLPSFNVTYPEQYLESVYYIPEEYRVYLSPIEWLNRMKGYIQGGWFGIHSHHSFVKESFYEYIGLFILHILALVTLLFKCKNNTSYCLIGKIGLLSLFSVLTVQYIFSYQTHLNSGYMGGLQPRYLLPFMFAFAIMASLFVERFKQYFLFNIFIILICIHAIYSDFFYFLQYYQ